MKLKDLGEFNLIKRIAKRIKLSSCVVKGIGDDAAILKYKKKRHLLFTCDMLIEKKHFYRNTGGYLIGKKALSVSVSDIVAMGGKPRFALISLGVPASLELKYINKLYKGIKSVAKKFKIDLVGGDTVNSRKIIINVALLGEVEREKIVLRSGAKEDDAIFITGNIGGSLKGKHLNFTPRLKEARFLVEKFKIHSMIDLSDGLIADLGHILESSNIGAVIYESKIPISKLAKDFASAIKEGEDFELVFTMPKSASKRLIKIWPFKIRLSKIGEVYKIPKALYLVRKNGRKQKIRMVGYSHF